MQLRLTHGTVRSWREADAAELRRQADNRAIWINLRDGFPHPYTLDDARRFIAMAMQRDPETLFAIAHDDAVIGGIGVSLGTDVERVGAEIGYWLAEPFWGRGITTEALVAVTRHAIDSFDLTRVFALPFEWNTASIRVLEKAGYTLEGRLRRSAIKDGQVIDQLLYAFVAPG